MNSTQICREMNKLVPGQQRLTQITLEDKTHFGSCQGEEINIAVRRLRPVPPVSIRFNGFTGWPLSWPAMRSSGSSWLADQLNTTFLFNHYFKRMFHRNIISDIIYNLISVIFRQFFLLKYLPHYTEKFMQLGHRRYNGFSASSARSPIPSISWVIMKNNRPHRPQCAHMNCTWMKTYSRFQFSL